MAIKDVKLYTDGGCSGNPGPGGYGVVLVHGEHRKELSGGFRLTTNNRMELTAAIEGLKSLKYGCKVCLYSDSKYLVDAINKRWLANWQRNNWRKSDKSAVKNIDLWMLLNDLLQKHAVTLHWVKGHAGHAENERCDQLANEALKRGDLPPDVIFEQSDLINPTRI